MACYGELLGYQKQRREMKVCAGIVRQFLLDHLSVKKVYIPVVSSPFYWGAVH